MQFFTTLLRHCHQTCTQQTRSSPDKRHLMTLEQIGNILRQPCNNRCLARKGFCGDKIALHVDTVFLESGQIPQMMSCTIQCLNRDTAAVQANASQPALLHQSHPSAPH